MKQLHKLAKELKANNFEMTNKIKEQFEEFLSIIAEGSRVLHPSFGLGTVTGTAGNSWIYVEFDKDLARRERENITEDYWYAPRKRMVMISSCTSIHMLIKREQQREIKKDFDL